MEREYVNNTEVVGHINALKVGLFGGTSEQYSNLSRLQDAKRMRIALQIV